MWTNSNPLPIESTNRRNVYLYYSNFKRKDKNSNEVANDFDVISELKISSRAEVLRGFGR